MKSQKSLERNEDQKILKMSQKDFNNVSEWYKASKNNYFKWNQDQSMKGDQLREVHLRVYFSQIYLDDLFLNQQIDLLRNLHQFSLSFTGGIFKSQDQQFKGKPYQNKNIQAYFDMNSKSLILREQINLYCYTLESKKRDSVFFLEFSLMNSQGETFKMGKLDFNMNSNLNQISELTIQKKNKQKVAFIQAIVEKQPIKDFPRLLPPNIIIDNKFTIPAIKSIQMKNRREPIILETRSKMKIISIEITIEDKNKLMEKLRKNNPFLSSHHENVEITQINFKIKIGTHNSWKFIEMKDEINTVNLKEKDPKPSQKVQSQQNQLKLVSSFDKGYLNKTYFECPNCVFTVLLYAQISYKYEGFLDKKTQSFGWCIVVNKIYEPSIKYQSFFQTYNSLPGYLMNFSHQGIKLSTQIDNPDHKNYRKRIEDDFSQLANFNQIFFDEQADQLTKTIFVKRQATERSVLMTSMGTFKEFNETQKQLQELIQQVEQEIKKVKRKILIKGHFVSPQPKVKIDKEKNWQGLLKLENKYVRLGMKLISMIPQTDEITFRKGQYYLPLKLRTKVHMMRKVIELEGQFMDKNASWNVPVFIKSNKQANFIETLIKDRQELKKVMDSLMLLTVLDVQNDRFYGKGHLSVMEILQSQQKARFQIQLLDETKKMGTLIIQISLVIRSGDTASNKRSVQPIQKTSIIQSLPMKQRLMMRISNFNNSNTELENKAISYYKQKNMPNVINQITNTEVNNAAMIEYQLGQATYYLLQFKNTSQSQNNIFSFFIKECDFAQIITDEQQYKQIIMGNNLNAIPYHKIDFHSPANESNQNNKTNSQHYTSKISHNQTVGLLIKVQLLQWNAKIKQQTNFSIQIQRNTIPVITQKFKLLFKQPIIHQTVTLYQINKNLSKGITLYLPQQITSTYQEFVSYSKDLLIKNKPKLELKLSTKQMLKSPHKLEFLIQGKIPISQFQNKTQNILLQVNLLDGQFVEVELGLICNKSFLIDTKIYPYLLNQILIIPDKNITQNVMSKNTVFIVSEQTQVNLRVCSFDIGLQNVIIKFFNLKYQLQYQYLLKLITRLKMQPIKINAQNFIGQKLILDCTNPYVSLMKFYIFSNTSSIRFDRQSFTIQPRSQQKVVLQIINKLYQKNYIAIYDDELILIQLFELEFFDQTGFKMFKIINQNHLPLS